MNTPEGELRQPASQADRSSHQPKLAALSQESPSGPQSAGEIGKRPASIDSRRGQDEFSPLIAPAREDIESPPAFSNVQSPASSDEWDVEPEETKSSWYLFLLTLSIGGLQIAWSVELSNGSPYLLGLGISKSLLAFVWIAGPLSGTLVQPYVGIKSDRCRSKWGKRRPFVVGGALCTIISLICLAWTKEIVANVLSLFGAGPDSPATKNTAIVVAVIFIYILDFSINTIQAGIRAFIVDNAPTHQQNDANAWASRLSGVGNILGYLSGYVNLPRYMPFFGNTQFKVLCVLACLALVVTVTVSCATVSERDPRLEDDPPEQKAGVVAFFASLYKSVRRLPPQIGKVCQVQFFAWIGWFPFLFYITTYVGEIYVEPYFEENPHMTPEEIDQTWERATRMGTFALLIFAITNFAATIVLPLLIAPTFEPPPPQPHTPLRGSQTFTPTTPGSMSANGYFAYQPNSSSLSSTSKKSKSLFTKLRNSIPSLQIKGLTLRRAWFLSHLMFVVATWITFFVRSTTAATILVAFIGIPWALTNWAPFALIAAEISKRDAIRRRRIPAPATAEGEMLTHGKDPAEGADQAGVVLGIHNVAIAAPQVIATLVSSVIFKVLQKPRGTPGDDSVAWVLRFGGCATLVAAYLTTKLSEDEDER
ncbi:hypothetical protein AAFC00_002982 [Neodothiora populina]|uniref:Sucrose transporter n=1 Tax=Neodothiora populina TaxID=2781224 RepID=A0ABR3P8W7_9PEZI